MVVSHEKNSRNVRLGALRIESSVQEFFVFGEPLHEIKVVRTNEKGEACAGGFAFDELQNLAASVDLVTDVDVDQIVEENIEGSVLGSRGNVDEMIWRRVWGVGWD